MKSKFRKWLHSRIHKHSSTNELERELPLPYLPHERPHLLTPATSQQDVTQKCPLFEKLPLEARRAILFHAFGGQLLHMDLSFDHPVASLNPSESGLPAQRGLDYTSPKAWKWWSSRCHRILPPHLQWPGWKDHYRSWPIPAMDTCHYDKVENRLPDEAPPNCHVGAMGWLLTCRQAYVEGVDVLYGTNSFHMSSKPMLLHLPELILPHRLAQISSLELVLSLRHSELGMKALNLAEFHQALEIISSHFHGLRRLHLSLTRFQGSSSAFDTDEILGLLDQFTIQRADLSDFVVDIPMRKFEDLFGATLVTTAASRKSSQGPQYVRDMIWRSASNACALVESPSCYPRRPDGLQNGESAVTEAGYWIIEGFEDRTTTYMACFGSTALTT